MHRTMECEADDAAIVAAPALRWSLELLTLTPVNHIDLRARRERAMSKPSSACSAYCKALRVTAVLHLPVSSLALRDKDVKVADAHANELQFGPFLRQCYRMNVKTFRHAPQLCPIYLAGKT
jgi:hypothetical protein